MKDFESIGTCTNIDRLVMFIGPMVETSYHKCEFVELGMREDGRPHAIIKSPFGHGGTLEAKFIHEQWVCLLD
mgnify:CR=1 FL=1|jgi:hypothetical protein